MHPLNRRGFLGLTAGLETCDQSGQQPLLQLAGRGLEALDDRVDDTDPRQQVAGGDHVHLALHNRTMRDAEVIERALRRKPEDDRLGRIHEDVDAGVREGRAVVLGAAAFTAFAAAESVGGSGFLAAFAAGVVIARAV